MSGELSALIERLGGVPCPTPAVREVPRLEQVPAFIDSLTADRFSTIIFLTGVGVSTLLREAERLGRLEETVRGLRAAVIACRGPKPVAALARYDVTSQIRAMPPYTSTELLDALGDSPLADTTVALVHYGERNPALADALRSRGARVDEECLYEWLLPEDLHSLSALVEDLIDQRMTAVAFTSQIQCRHLFQVARQMGKSELLTRALNDEAIVVAIGPVCAASLRAHGVTPDVVPAQPKMGPMVTALADYIEVFDIQPSTS